MHNRCRRRSPFWRFSLHFYRQPGVADACIALQEQSGVDVNLLMYLLWQAGQRRSFSPDEVAWLESKIGPWRESAVVPLRAVRRALKEPPSLMPAGTAEAFRTRVKAVELEAERLQQQAMYELETPLPFGTDVNLARRGGAHQRRRLPDDAGGAVLEVDG